MKPEVEDMLLWVLKREENPAQQVKKYKQNWSYCKKLNVRYLGPKGPPVCSLWRCKHMKLRINYIKGEPGPPGVSSRDLET